MFFSSPGSLVMAWLTVPVILLSMACCSTTTPEAAAPSPPAPVNSADAEVSATVEQWKQAMLQQDVNGAMAVYSERFRHELLGGKAEERAYLEETMRTGNLQGVRVDTSQARVDVREQQAIVAPIRIESPPGGFGALNYALRLHQEQDGWKITARSASHE